MPITNGPIFKKPQKQVVFGYYHNEEFWEDANHTTKIPPPNMTVMFT